MDRSRIVALLVAGVLAVAGCGSAAPATPGAPTATPVSPVPTPAAAASPSPSATPVFTPTQTPTATPATSTGPASPPAAGWREVPQQSSVSGVQFQDVTWTGTRFVAIGWALDGRGVFLDSSDGITWHRQKGMWLPGPLSLAAGPGGVVAVGLIGGQPASWYSADGLTWLTRRKAFPTPRLGTDTVQVADVVARGDGWLAVGSRDPRCSFHCVHYGRAYVWTSRDGLHWTRIADQKALSGGGMRAVARGDDGFVAVGEASSHAAIWTSRNGLAWSRVPDDRMFRGGSVEGISLLASAMGVAARDGRVVAVGADSSEVVARAHAWWTADGRRWSKASVEKAVWGPMFSVAATPTGFLATGASGEESCLGGIWASTDGRAWRCDASDPAFEGFTPMAAAVSNAVEVAVGTFSDDSVDFPETRGAVWYRTSP